MLSLFEHAQRDAAWLLPPRDPKIQPVDVRDVARFALDQIAVARAGVYNLTAPIGHATYGDLIDACLEATEGTATPVHASEEWLVQQGVGQWTEIPLWRTSPGTWQVDGAKATAAGFMSRPTRETVLDTWADYQEQQPVYHPRQDQHGMDPAREEHLVRLWSDLARGDTTREM
jgi:nucleoside-diphosphate-sugar epimerase